MFQRFKYAMQRFFYGRYGVDQLNTVLLVLGIVLCIVGMMTRVTWLTYVSYIPLILAIYRTYSRNLQARRRENQRLLSLVKQLKDRDNRYFSCPKCRQKVRVPKGKGTVKIRCPKCGEQFVKKT